MLLWGTDIRKRFANGLYLLGDFYQWISFIQLSLV